MRLNCTQKFLVIKSSIENSSPVIMAVESEMGTVDGSEQPQRRHKIPVPTNYRSATKILRQVVEERGNVKSLILGDKHLRKGKGLAMMDLILVNLKQIEDILARTKLLEKEPRLNPWLAKVLVAELVFGRGELSGESRPVQCVRSYRDVLQEALGKSDVPPPKLSDFKEPRYVRINTNALAQPGAVRLLQEEGWVLVDEDFASYADYLERVKCLGDSEFLVDFHFKEVLVFPNSAKNYWARATELKQKFVLQNKACLLPTYLLNPPKKSVVLDMCAAPGLKTTHLANLMKNKGRIFAVERDATRYKLLCEYAADFGVIKTLNEDCLLVGDEQAPGVEYILIDPSCSGSGMVGRLKLNEEVDKQRLFKLGGLQYKLLCHAMNSFPGVKRIVYSTCSIYPEENEEIVQGALKHNGHFKLADAKALLGMEWLNLGSSDYTGIGEKCLYSRPESDLTIGMFVAVFERCEEEEYNEVYMAHEKQKESYEKLSKIGQVDFGKGKRKKRQRDGGMEESDQTIETNQENQQMVLGNEEKEHVDDLDNFQKKKKRKSEEHKRETVEMKIETDETETIQNGTKKKKKKHKTIEVNTVEENCDVLQCEKRKKKKKTCEENEPEQIKIETEQAEVLQNGTEKKKKKHKIFEVNEVKEECEGKKKKKRKTSEEQEPEQSNIEINQNGTEKKRKKHKNQVNEENETTENLQSMEAEDVLVIKKKKRKHADEEKTNVEQDNPPENCTEDVEKSKKKKKRRRNESVEGIIMEERPIILEEKSLPSNKTKKKKKKAEIADGDN